MMLPTPVTPSDDPLERQFWAYCAEDRLCFQRCDDCGRCQHPPMPRCMTCGGARLGWMESAGNGRVFSYTIVHHASTDALVGHMPYIGALVTLDDIPGVRILTNIEAASPEVAIGMPVRVQWRDAPGPLRVPRFREAGEAADV